MDYYNLPTFDNIYASLAQSTYTNRPKNFPINQLDDKSRSKIDSGQSVPFDFSQDVTHKDITTSGGRNLPHNGVVYLQPDPDLRTVAHTTDLPIPNMNGGYTTTSYATSWSQKGLLTDSDAGFNAYFLTDTPKLDATTSAAYLAIRGSDGISLSNLNDWLDNNAVFTLSDGHIPQAKLATQAMTSLISDIKASGSSAKLDVTGHSLGTMVSIQGAAGLSSADLDRVGKIVLFNGPDPTASLKKMGLTSQQLAALSAKTTYYVNPFDLVSMLNRTAPYEQQFGTVYVIVPLHFKGAFENPSSHDFGAYQMDPNGNPLVASKDYHPELLEAGRRLAALNQETIARLKKLGVSDSAILSLLQGNVLIRGVAGYDVYKDFEREYNKIIAEARAASVKWDKENIPKYQARIRSAKGAEKIRLQAELLQTAAQLATLETEDQVTQVKKLISDARETIQTHIQTAHTQVYGIARYISAWELESMLSSIQLDAVWDETVETSTNKAAQQFGNTISEFSAALVQASQTLTELDQQTASLFENLSGGK